MIPAHNTSGFVLIARSQAEPRPSGSGGADRSLRSRLSEGTSSQRFQVFDDSLSFAFGEMVAEGVAAVATARLRGVVNLAACPSRQLGIGTLVDELHPPTEPDWIVVFLARAVRTREHRRPGFGIEHV